MVELNSKNMEESSSEKVGMGLVGSKQSQSNKWDDSQDSSSQFKRKRKQRRRQDDFCEDDETVTATATLDLRNTNQQFGGFLEQSPSSVRLHKDTDSDALSTCRLTKISQLAYEVENQPSDVDFADYGEESCMPLQLEAFKHLVSKQSQQQNILFEQPPSNGVSPGSSESSPEVRRLPMSNEDDEPSDQDKQY